MAQYKNENLIEKLVFGIDTEISNEAKYIFLEIIQNEFIDKNKNAKY